MALLSSEQETATDEAAGFSVPSYMVAANSHNIANNNWSWGDAATYGTAGVLTSAAVQTWNILPTLGNLLGGDFEEIKAKDILQGFDDDMGKYYVDHQEGIDALGFALGSIVPGSIGVKVGKAGFNILRGAAEAGTFGAGISEATGLLASKMTKVLPEAMELAAKPNGGFPVWNAKTIQAIVQGAGQSALEGAAFETAVAATMYNSPTLKDKDFGDLVSNVIHGSLAFGAIGGVFHGASTISKIKLFGRETDKELIDFNTIRMLPESRQPSDHIMNALDQLNTLPSVETARVAGGWTEEAGNAWKTVKATTMLESKTQALKLQIRDNFGKIANGDQVLADSLYKNFAGLDVAGAEAKVWSSEEITRLGTATKFEAERGRALQKFSKSLELKDVESIPNKSTTFLKLAGEDAGRIVSSAPTLLNVADKIKSGVDYKSAIEGYGQRLGKTEAWNHLETDAFTSEARYVTALKTEFTPETVVHVTDLPYLQAAYLKGVDGLQVAEGGFDKGLHTGGRIINNVSRQELLELISATKQSASNDMLAKGMDPQYIGKVLDMRRELVEGTLKGDMDSALMITRTPDQWAAPQWAKVTKDLNPVKDIDGNVVTGMVALKRQQVMFQDAADRTSASILGEDAGKVIRVPDEFIVKANRGGPGNSMFAAQNGNYGSLGSLCQSQGGNTLKIIERVQNGTRESATPVLQKLLMKDSAAIEFSVLNSNLRKYGEGFIYSAESGGMIPTRLAKYNQAIAAGKDVKVPEFESDLPMLIPIKNPEVAELVQTHTKLNSARVQGYSEIYANRGLKFTRDPDSFYPIPANPRDYPFFAHVIDDTVSGYGHSKMLFAADAGNLEAQITAVKSADPTLKVLTGKEAEKYYKAIGQYEFERTLTDTAFNPGIARAGKSSNYLPPTDSKKIVEDFLNWHLQRDSALVRETVLHVNEAQVGTLRQMGEAYADVKGSHFSSMDPVSYLEMQGTNPYADYVKSMLGLTTAKEFPFWTTMNDMLDRKVSGIIGAVRTGVQQAKSPEELVKLNSMLRDSGYTGSAYDSMTAALANSSVPRGYLSSFVGKANTLITAGMLGWDFVNPIVNLLGATVLRSTELTSLLRNIEKGNVDAAGGLANLFKVKVPGTDQQMLSPTKMIARAMGDLFSDAGTQFTKELQLRGIDTSITQQSKWVLDNLAIGGKETVAELDSKVNTVFAGMKTVLNAGEKITGNKLAEHTNRFISAHIAKQITDQGIKAGVIGPEEAWATINTFVNRVEGNYIAAQRPGIFTGPVGQAMGLFQTYQFNLLQQLFRHIGEGSAKDLVVMAGMQGTLFGAKGMPAFDAINQHILGNSSGNVEHRDAYTSVYGAAGKEAGDWLMYGVASNALGIISPDLKANLYSRGDINPRQVTVLPTNPTNFPFVQMSTKLFGSLFETMGKIGAGGDVLGSVLQGIEHAGVNRPLAGLAQSLEAAGNPMSRSYSTSNKGNVVASNDFLSLANMIRIAGAKPLDEAIALDKFYNVEAYAASDTKKRNALGEAIKTTVIAGKSPTQDQITGFAAQYAATGGQQHNFAQFMLQQMRSANTSQVNVMAQQLKNPTARAMQEVMGGYGMKDFINSGTEQ